MPADTHIPVTAGTWEKPHLSKQPCQTYDYLLRALAQQQRRQDLKRRLRRLVDAALGLHSRPKRLARQLPLVQTLLQLKIIPYIKKDRNLFITHIFWQRWLCVKKSNPDK
jgi:hypothetical protein